MKNPNSTTNKVNSLFNKKYKYIGLTVLLSLLILDFYTRTQKEEAIGLFAIIAVLTNFIVVVCTRIINHLLRRKGNYYD